MNEKPLFVPLKAKFYDAFERGEKDTEYRPYGPRWNDQVCRIGRQVVLSKGYGTKHRLAGVIVGFHRDSCPSKIPGWVECYGYTPGYAACIKIKRT